jgi:hypothetical protein
MKKIDTFDYNKKKRQWLEDKQGMFSASKISVLLSSKPTDAEIKKHPTLKFGKGAMTYIEQVVNQCISKVEDNDFGSGIFQLENGIRLEGIAIDTFLKSHYKELPKECINLYGEGNPTFFKYNQYSGCSPDCIIKIPQLKYNLGIEAKCPNIDTQRETIVELHKKALLIMKMQPEIDNYNFARQMALKEWNYQYYCQVQFQMMCFGFGKWFWISYNEMMNDIGARMIVLPIVSDKKLQTEIQIKLANANEVKNEIIADYNTALHYGLNSYNQK